MNCKWLLPSMAEPAFLWQGCDGSILLDTPPEGKAAEKDSPFNGASLRGLEVVDVIKARLEIACPGTVSCADILAFAARDVASIAGIPNYEVPSGRLDGRTSLADEVPYNLPMPLYNLTILANLFASKGLDLQDLIVLSGAHSLGQAHCPAFQYRLYQFSPSQKQDPSLDPSYANHLKSICGSTTQSLDESPAVPLEPISSSMMTTTYYTAIVQHKGLLGTDQALMGSVASRRLVRKFARYHSLWAQMFADAMVKVGKLAHTSNETGEVRKYCRSINGWRLPRSLPLLRLQLDILFSVRSSMCSVQKAELDPQLYPVESFVWLICYDGRISKANLYQNKSLLIFRI